MAPVGEDDASFKERGRAALAGLDETLPWRRARVEVKELCPVVRVERTPAHFLPFSSHAPLAAYPMRSVSMVSSADTIV